METCILTLLVTLEQEQAIRKLFKRRGWDFKTTGDILFFDIYTGSFNAIFHDSMNSIFQMKIC